MHQHDEVDINKDTVNDYKENIGYDDWELMIVIKNIIIS